MAGSEVEEGVQGAVVSHLSSVAARLQRSGHLFWSLLFSLAAGKVRHRIQFWELHKR